MPYTLFVVLVNYMFKFTVYKFLTNDYILALKMSQFVCYDSKQYNYRVFKLHRYQFFSVFLTFLILPYNFCMHAEECLVVYIVTLAIPIYNLSHLSMIWILISVTSQRSFHDSKHRHLKIIAFDNNLNYTRINSFQFLMVRLNVLYSFWICVCMHASRMSQHIYYDSKYYNNAL